MKYPCDDEFFDDDDYAEEDANRPCVNPYELTPDEVLDDPRHGQGDK